MKFILLGINGSIGKTTLKVFETIKNKWEIVGFSIGDDAKNVDELINKYHPLAISFKNEKDYYLYKSLYPNIKFFFGSESYLKLLDLEYDCLINALSGFNGLEPTLKCLENNKTVLLANKESLVVGGELIKKTLKTSGKLIPIDSEHVA
ncbi:MAG: 1-deoxy-D-xylulose-5-phosphate reductoisomerase, partial [Bacilli bacterium]|nr:1-deoxy-D-xylulose-5-phosphate reductoisomerase [Bacilli bacterium]MDY5832495.1 1-deoxy-D-xylulose-5-phosphate reductoisomerase [Candidatus Onthovivens sp.]